MRNKSEDRRNSKKIKDGRKERKALKCTSQGMEGATH